MIEDEGRTKQLGVQLVKPRARPQAGYQHRGKQENNTNEAYSHKNEEDGYGNKARGDIIVAKDGATEEEEMTDEDLAEFIQNDDEEGDEDEVHI